VNAFGIIPARWGSTRFPGKPLALINGKALLTWVIEGAQQSQLLKEIYVATDDSRIADLAKTSGAHAIMTDSELPTGTDRIWQAVQRLGAKIEVDAADVVVNIQGDEPLIEGQLLDRLIEPFLQNGELEMATLGRELSQEALVSDQTAKIVLNKQGEAIYFSRFPIPFSRNSAGTGSVQAALKHIGIYAYRSSFLAKFCAQAPTELEHFEGLEQLRALYLGARIKVVRVEHESWGVDVPEDVARIEKIMKGRNR
jgi:3-deoxy-manno-octulosonate cytidylyltransferase (CMP-KDO synthetase)